MQTWLKVASIITILTGLSASLATFPAGETAWRVLFDILTWPLDGKPDGFSNTARALNAVLGGVMAGWGLSIFLLMNNSRIASFREVYFIILLSLIFWFIIDSIGSFIAGIPGNVILNIVFLAMFLVPLVVIIKKMPARENNAD